MVRITITEWQLSTKRALGGFLEKHLLLPVLEMRTDIQVKQLEIQVDIYGEYFGFILHKYKRYFVS